MVCSAPVWGGEVVYKSSFSGGGVVCPDPSSCGPDWSYDEGDEKGQGESMSQRPPQRSGRGSEETDSILYDGREEVCQEPMEEELTVIPLAHKAKKRKHHYAKERVAVKDGTRYYDAEGYISQCWPNPSRCPTENVVAPAPSKE